MSVKCECGKEHPDWVPKERLSKVTQQRKDAEAARDEALNKASELEASAGRVTELEASLAGLQTQLGVAQMQGSIMKSGVVSEEGMAVVATLWAAVPEDARPPGGLSEWLTSSDAPQAVRVYLPQPPTEQPPAAAAPAQPPAAPPAAAPPAASPPSSAGVHNQPPSANGTPTAQQIDAMSDAEYAAWREAHGGSIYSTLQAARAGQS